VNTSVIKSRIKRMERQIKICKSLGFSTKRLFDARSQYISMLKDEGGAE
jgi:hypothetical protein